jgi:MFS family permease
MTVSAPAVAGTADRRRWLALGLLCLAFFVDVLASTSVFTAAPSIAADLGLSAAGAQWLFTACTLPGGALLLCGGRLADLYGARRVFVAGTGLLTVASLVCAAAPSTAVLVGARAGQGVAAALMMPAALALVVSTFDDPAERNKALAAWSAVGGVGATAGLLFGGAVTGALGWPWVFGVNVPVGVVMIVLSPVLLRADRRVAGRGRLDLPGVLAATVALGSVVYGLSQVPGRGWARPDTLGLVAAGLVLLGVFVLVESRTAWPMLPLRLFRNRRLVGGNLVLVAAGMTVDGLLFTVTRQTQEVLDYSALRFGVLTSVMTVSSVAAAWVAQRWVTAVGVRAVAGGGGALLVLACVVMAWSTRAGRPGVVLLAGMLVFGLGMGGAFVAGSIASLADVAGEDAGIAAGLQTVSFSVGATLGVALQATVAALRTGAVVGGGAAPGAVADGVLAGSRAAFLAGAVIALLGTAAALAIRVERPPN